jgi:hypothetical protein
MHRKASRGGSPSGCPANPTALESGGLTQLLPQAFRFADMLTPAVLKAISDLITDWLDHKLSVKGYVTCVSQADGQCHEEPHDHSA